MHKHSQSPLLPAAEVCLQTIPWISQKKIITNCPIDSFLYSITKLLFHLIAISCLQALIHYWFSRPSYLLTVWVYTHNMWDLCKVFPHHQALTHIPKPTNKRLPKTRKLKSDDMVNCYWCASDDDTTSFIQCLWIRWNANRDFSSLKRITKKKNIERKRAVNIIL